MPQENGKNLKHGMRTRPETERVTVYLHEELKRKLYSEAFRRGLKFSQWGERTLQKMIQLRELDPHHPITMDELFGETPAADLVRELQHNVTTDCKGI